MFGRSKPITDVCMLCRDLNQSVEFYRDKVGLSVRLQADGFADFHTKNVRLALWQIDHFTQHVGYTDSSASGHKVMTALEVDDTKDVDDIFHELSGRGVQFLREPKEYPWNAYCAYFQDPDENVWEIYSWVGEGAEGYHETFADK